MSPRLPPEAAYEHGWSTCRRCGTRRPDSALIDGTCNDGWCERVLEERARRGPNPPPQPNPPRALPTRRKRHPKDDPSPR